MAHKLAISDDLKLPLELAQETTAVLGIRGAGKTNTAGVIAEELLDARQPVCVIDPTDAWWGLKSSSDGKSEGYPVIVFGGEHADAELEPASGKALAEFIVHEQAPSIMSLRHLRKHEQRHFVTQFCEELYHLKGKAQFRSPLTVIIDEAPLFAPQQVSFSGKGEDPASSPARTLGAIEDLIARGRVSGFGVVLISQRAATVNKNVLTQADTLIAHRLIGPPDRKAIKDWFEQNASTETMDEILESLATLQKGEAWVWSPQLDIMKRVQIRLRRTFDSSASPKMGQKIKPPKKLAEVDLEKLRTRLSDAVEKIKADDPRELKKRIADLVRQNGQLMTRTTVEMKQPTEKVKRVEVPVVREIELKRFEAASAKLHNILDSVHAALTNGSKIASAIATVDDIHKRVRDLARDPQMPPGYKEFVSGTITRVAKSVGMSPALSLRDPPAPRATRANVAAAGGDGAQLQPAHFRILDALAWLETFGIKQPDRANVAAIAGASSKSSSFTNNISRLNTAGLISYPANGALTLTDAGRASGFATFPETAPTLQTLHDAWRRSPALQPAHVQILDALIKHYPKAISREDLATAAGASALSSSFTNNLSRLSSLGVADYPAPGQVRATQLLFPEGLS